ncbi:hypothetical protein GCM10010211_64090 [Streptomyces albospinus]|uniref:Uncharacterized protein n=1 Tax=Streptomyces albospinus TaxID=285515 RepID=A0ABQ2VJF0_9ACTN|nr:hypothetical protein GCM10010211_64090 [Streptomyces albospinus]
MSTNGAKPAFAAAAGRGALLAIAEPATANAPPAASVPATAVPISLAVRLERRRCAEELISCLPVSRGGELEGGAPWCVPHASGSETDKCRDPYGGWRNYGRLKEAEGGG